MRNHSEFFIITLIVVAVNQQYVDAKPNSYWGVDGSKFLIETDQKVCRLQKIIVV